MIGKLLKGRYQIVQFISAGAFGHIYLAADIHQPGNPKCIVKHLQSFSKDPRCLPAAKRRFISETVTLKRLGNCPQIPQLLACFEDNQEFYLVQEFILGHPLSAELPASKGCICCWQEHQVIQMLQAVLEILEFVRSQDIIHCDIKPSNILRRVTDDKLFLIDFGAAQPVRQSSERLAAIAPVGENASQQLLGYTPAEQLIGYACPGSDIYALGIIGIQALIGLEPSQLTADPETGEIQWQHLYLRDQPAANRQLAAILSQMVRRDFRQRYQSAAEVLAALQQLNASDRLAATAELEDASSMLPIFDLAELDAPTSPSPAKKSSPVLTSMGVGIAVNAVAIAFGTYSLLHATASDSEPDILVKASQEYQLGDINRAISLAKSIPASSPVYPEAQAAILEWHRDWQLAAAQFRAVSQAASEGRWLEAIANAEKIPQISFWQEQVQPLIAKARPHVEAKAKELLAKAYERAIDRDFTAALNYLQQIPSDTAVGATVQRKLIEYSQKQQIKADYFLQKAYDRAIVQDFAQALEYLKEIPAGTAAFAKAQAKIAEYEEKQRIIVENTKTIAVTTFDGSAAEPSPNLNPGDRLQENQVNYILHEADQPK